MAQTDPTPLLEMQPERPFVIRRHSSSGSQVARGPTHENPGYELTWVESGRVEFEVGSAVLAASAGACVLLPPGLENTARGRTTVCHQILIHPRLLDEAADSLGTRIRPPAWGVVLGMGERATSLAALIAREAETGLDHRDPGLSALIDALAVGLVRPGAHAVAPGPTDPRIRRALELIAQEYAQPLSVQELAAAAGLSRFAFLRIFRAQAGESPYRFLTNYRLDRAAERLRRTSESVLDVALACGFSDPGRFARFFKARFGCAPRVYRTRSGHDSPNR